MFWPLPNPISINSNQFHFSECFKCFTTKSPLLPHSPLYTYHNNTKHSILLHLTALPHSHNPSPSSLSFPAYLTIHSLSTLNHSIDLNLSQIVNPFGSIHSILPLLRCRLLGGVKLSFLSSGFWSKD